MEPRSFHLHLVSDATGETLGSLARACMAQFEGVRSIEHLWPMVRNDRQVARVLAAVKAEPGVVLFTIVDDNLRAALEEGCNALNIPCIPVLDPVIHALAAFLGMESRGEPGRQHALDAEYFHRIEAMQFALAHDDGQSVHDLNKADVILVGVSRTSKTPTCIYLANRGLKAANVPFVQVRRNRLKLLDQGRETDYVDPDAVRDEVENAKRYFTSRQWPVIDVTRRSIEETAATVIQYHARRQRKEA